MLASLRAAGRLPGLPLPTMAPRLSLPLALPLSTSQAEDPRSARSGASTSGMHCCALCALCALRVHDQLF